MGQKHDFNRNIFYYVTFSRHGRTRTSSALLIWLNENDGFLWHIQLCYHADVRFRFNNCNKKKLVAHHDLYVQRVWLFMS